MDASFISPTGPVADVVLVYAKTDKLAGAKGISAFIVERGFPGFAVAQKLDKMGFRGSPTAELVFDDCIVPATNLVGEENRGVAVVMSGLDLERAIVAMINVGMAERRWIWRWNMPRTREQFGAPIGSFQLGARQAGRYVCERGNGAGLLLPSPGRVQRFAAWRRWPWRYSQAYGGCHIICRGGVYTGLQ